MTLAEWRHLLSINLDGPFIVCHAALAALQASGNATIVNIASGAGLQPRQNFSAYCASKGGLVMFSKAIAVSQLLSEGVSLPDTPCIRAAFAASLRVYALATNGYGRLSNLDAPQSAGEVGLRGFVVTPV